MRFKQEFPLRSRRDEAYRVIEKYPDRLPVICEKSHYTNYDCPDIDKRKYLVPKDLTMGQFLYVIRKRLSVGPEKGLFLFVGYSIPPSTALVSEIYKNYVDDDGFLYITYSFENVFG
jgi:GABA(A) receptor-associated protein